MGRAPCCDKSKVKKGPWSPEEDTILKNHLKKHGTGGNWIAIPQKAGLNRCGKSCRLRWLNYLRPNIRHGGFTEEEDNIILTLYSNIGSRWSVIASHLTGRTDNDVKNYWNTKLKKKLVASTAKPTGLCNLNHLSIDSPFHSGNSAWSESNTTTTTSPYRTQEMNYQEINTDVPGLLFSGSIGFSFPELLEIQENGSSLNSGTLHTVSSSQEVPNISTSFSLEDSTHASWFSSGGSEENGFPIELDYGFPFDLQDGFDFQGKMTESSPKLACSDYSGHWESQGF